MRTSDYVRLLVLAAIWGASFLFMRIAAPAFGALPAAALRAAIAALFLLPILLWRAPGRSQALTRSAPRGGLS